ncbi:EamA family transporter [Kribbella sancticallisti]|uniref:EamA family transporter n=1 Tax=Kribbella sancticallisti TaxID=460087 RepID=A0ABN2D3U1_9ACTN
MNLTALSLVLIAAVLHAGWNFSAKRVQSGGTTFVWAYYTIAAVVLLPAAVVAAAAGGSDFRWTWLIAALVTAVLHIAYALVLQRGYDVAALSVVYPVARGLGPLLSIVLAVLFLGERPGPIGLVGGVLIVSGVFVIGWSGRSAATRGAVKAGVFYGVAIGGLIAGYTLWDAYSVATLDVPPLIYFGTASVMQSVLLTPHALRDRGRLRLLWREHRREVLIVGMLSPAAYLLVLYAMRLAPVSLVAPAREVSIVLSGLAAWLLLGEANAVRRLGGSVIVLAGIVAIALS